MTLLILFHPSSLSPRGYKTNWLGLALLLASRFPVSVSYSYIDTFSSQGSPDSATRAHSTSFQRQRTHAGALLCV